MSGILNPIHWFEPGTNPCSPAALSSSSLNHSDRFSPEADANRNSSSDDETSVSCPTDTSSLTTLPDSSRKNRSPKALQAIRVTDFGYNHRHSLNRASKERWPTSNTFFILIEGELYYERKTRESNCVVAT